MRPNFWILFISIFAFVLLGLSQYFMIASTYDLKLSKERSAIHNLLSNVYEDHINFRDTTIMDHLLDCLNDSFKIEQINNDKNLNPLIEDEIAEQIYQFVEDSIDENRIKWGIYLMEYSTKNSEEEFSPIIQADSGELIIGTLESVDNAFSFSTLSNQSDSIKIVIKTYQQIVNERSYILKKLWPQWLLILSLFFLLGGALYYIYSQLNKLNDEVSLQKSFVDNVVHEFQTPLTSIKLAASKLDHPNFDSSHSNLSENKDFIHQELNRVSFLIDQIKSGHWSETGIKLHPKFIDSNPFITNLYNQYRSEYKKERDSFLLNKSLTSHTLSVDPHYFSMAILNLINNAFKHNNNQVEVSLNTYASNNHFHVEVVDNGIGITLNSQKKIFEKYYREESKIARPGLGIGLYLVKQIIEAHDGSVSLLKIDKGAKFIISVPIEK